jgi:hypothetical protein
VSRVVLLACGLLATSCVWAADLPRCDKDLKVAELGTGIDCPPTDLPEGKVFVEFTVDAKGRVSHPKIAESVTHSS